MFQAKHASVSVTTLLELKEENGTLDKQLLLDGRHLVCGLLVMRLGHPRPSLSGPSVAWVSLPGPTGVQSHPR